MPSQRRQPGRRGGRHTHRWIMPQGIRIVVVLPTLSDQEHHGPQERRQVMHDIGLAAAVLHPRRHPADNPGRVESFSQQYCARIARQALGASFDRKRAVESGRDRP